MKKRHLFFGFIAISSLVLIFFTGCEEPNIDALENEKGIYSIYGALDIDQTTNYIRVKDLRLPLSADSDSIDAVTEFEILETGARTILRDTVVEFNGNFTHNYILNQDLAPKKSYKVTVNRSDGNSVSSVATMPGITEHEVEPSQVAQCVSPVEITFENVLPDEQIRLEVGFGYDGGFLSQEVSRFCKFEREGNQLSLLTSTKDLLGMVFPAPGVNLVTCKGTPPAFSCDELPSNKVQLRYLHLGPEWQNVFPLYPNDPEDVADVDNGLGFFGGYRQDTLSYRISSALFD